MKMISAAAAMGLVLSASVVVSAHATEIAGSNLSHSVVLDGGVMRVSDYRYEHRRHERFSSEVEWCAHHRHQCRDHRRYWHH